MTHLLRVWWPHFHHTALSKTPHTVRAGRGRSFGGPGPKCPGTRPNWGRPSNADAFLWIHPGGYKPTFAGMTSWQVVRQLLAIARFERVGAFRAGVADCLTDPGIVCFPAAPPPKAQTEVPRTQRGSITRPEKEFRRARPEMPRHADALGLPLACSNNFSMYFQYVKRHGFPPSRE